MKVRKWKESEIERKRGRKKERRKEREKDRKKQRDYCVQNVKAKKSE